MPRFSVGKNLPLILTGLVALGLVAAATYVHFSRPNDQKKADTVPSSHPGAGAAGTAEPSEPSSSTNPGSNPPPPPNPVTDPQYNSSTLAKPTQTINKSRGYISLSATDAADPQHSPSMDSTCSSVEGATCEIHATMGSSHIIVVSATQIDPATLGIDVGWNAKDKGLTPGTWTITAVAKKGGQTMVSDPINLEVRS